MPSRCRAPFVLQDERAFHETQHLDSCLLVLASDVYHHIVALVLIVVTNLFAQRGTSVGIAKKTKKPALRVVECSIPESECGKMPKAR